MYQDETRHGDRPRTRRDCVRWAPSFPLKGHSPANFHSCLVWPNGADGSRCHLVRRYASPRRHCVRWPPSSPSKGGRAAATQIFGPYWPIVAKQLEDQDATWREVGLDPWHIVLDGNRASPSRQKGHSPIFGPCVCCGQTAGWIKMPLGTEEGLGPGDIVDLTNPIIFIAILPTFHTLSMSIVAKRVAHISYC